MPANAKVIIRGPEYTTVVQECECCRFNAVKKRSGPEFTTFTSPHGEVFEVRNGHWVIGE